MAISPLKPQRNTGWLSMVILLLLLLLSIAWFVDPLGESNEAAVPVELP